MRNKYLKFILIGIISIYINNVNSKAIYVSFSVSQPPPLEVSIGKDTSVCQGKFAIHPLTSGGTSPFTYNWNSGCAGDSCIVITTGAYTLTVTDINGCTSIAKSININTKPAPSFNDSIPNLFECEGKSITLTANAAGSNLNYQWEKGGSNIIGATTSTYIIPKLKPSDYNLYTCKVSNECGTKNLPTFILTVLSPPTSNIKYIKQTKYLYENTSFSLSPGGTSPFTFQWIKGENNISGATNSIFNINSVSCGDSGIYSCKISNSCSDITVKIVELYILGCNRFKFAILGNVKYDNKDSTLLSNINVHLKNMGDTIIDNNTTDFNGNYVFVDLINESYKISCNTSKPWGGGNPVDALLVNRDYIGVKHITDPLKKRAADVNNDTKINPTDALIINRRYIGILDKYVDKNKVTLPDWIFSDPTVKLEGLDFTQNILAICLGDVNASYIPAKRIINNVFGIKNNTLSIKYNEPFDIPVFLNENTELGAIGIKLKIKNEKIKITGIKSELPGLIYNYTGDGVNIAWSANNESYSINPDKPLFYTSAIIDKETGINMESVNNNFHITSESVLADIEGNYIGTDKLVIPKLQFSAQHSALSIQTYPNPFSSFTSIYYTIPEDANIEITLYDILGKKIEKIVTNELQQSGKHTIQYNASTLREGVYYCVLRLTTKNLQQSITNILVKTR